MLSKKAPITWALYLLLAIVPAIPAAIAQQPATIEISMPSIMKELQPPAKSTITLILAKNHQVYYYSGLHYQPHATKKIPIIKVHALLIQKQKDVAKANKTASAKEQQLHVIIKPDNNSTYKDLVDILDEMAINKIEKYAIVDISAKEKARVK